MELLSPAGGFEQLKAAVHFGADAVYCGMKQYSLRAKAENFEEGIEKVRQIIDSGLAKAKLEELVKCSNAFAG